MIHTLTQFAADSGQNVFASLGIDWQMLILQIIAFLLLVVALGKWVYPWLIKSVDERQANIEATSKAALEAQAAAEKAESKMEDLLKKARTDAADIIATAKLESTNALAESEAKAKKRADQIVADAQVDIQKEVISARKALRDETLDLVMLATEKVTSKAITAKLEESLVKDAIKAAE